MFCAYKSMPKTADLVTVLLVFSLYVSLDNKTSHKGQFFEIYLDTYI